MAPGKCQTVAGVSFANYGAHSNDCPQPYLTAAAAIGTTTKEVDMFVERLGKVFEEYRRKYGSSGSSSSSD